MRPTGTLVDPADADQLAFEGSAPEREARPADAYPAYALDAFYAAGRALGTVPRVMPHREALMRLPDYDIRHLDRFEDYARALRFVQTEILRHYQRSTELPALAAEGWRIRRAMMSYAEALSFKGLFAPEIVGRLRRGGGYQDLAEDLSVLVGAFLDLPEVHIGPHAAVTAADLNRASEIAHHVNVHAGNKPKDTPEATLRGERRKIGGLLLEAHDEIRRGMSYFRWKQRDVAKVVPSLRVPRRARKTRDPATEPPAELAALHAQLRSTERRDGVD